MGEVLERTEANIEIFHAAKKKFYSCPHANVFFLHGNCDLYMYTMDTGHDMANHCIGCLTNTKKPSNVLKGVRSR
ncbi:MAG: hypothetical protein HGA85_02615 [Nanoarchaeota archaeon]|nr:hypothetical protein [Nanoarchaeota archaeon]